MDFFATGRDERNNRLLHALGEELAVGASRGYELSERLGAVLGVSASKGVTHVPKHAKGGPACSSKRPAEAPLYQHGRLSPSLWEVSMNMSVHVKAVFAEFPEKTVHNAAQKSFPEAAK